MSTHPANIAQDLAHGNFGDLLNRQPPSRAAGHEHRREEQWWTPEIAIAWRNGRALEPLKKETPLHPSQQSLVRGRGLDTIQEDLPEQLKDKTQLFERDIELNDKSSVTSHVEGKEKETQRRPVIRSEAHSHSHQHISPEIEHWINEHKLSLFESGFTLPNILKVYDLYHNKVDIFKTHLKRYNTFVNHYRTFRDNIIQLKLAQKNNQQKYEVAKHEIEGQLRKAITELNILHSRGLQMEIDFPHFPDIFHHFKHHDHFYVQNVNSNHAFQQTHVPQIHEQSKGQNTTTNSANSHNEDHNIWTYLDFNHWLKHFNHTNTRNKFEAINATKGLYISA